MKTHQRPIETRVSSYIAYIMWIESKLINYSYAFILHLFPKALYGYFVFAS